MLVAIYCFIGVSTALAVLSDYSRADIIASVLLGVIWPVYVSSKLVQKLTR
jgi:hypothetical protein